MYTVRIKGGKLKPLSAGLPARRTVWTPEQVLKRRQYIAARKRHARSPRAIREWGKRDPMREGR